MYKVKKSKNTAPKKVGKAPGTHAKSDFSFDPSKKYLLRFDSKKNIRMPPELANKFTEIRVSEHADTPHDILGSMKDLSAIPSENIDAIWSPGNLHYFHRHDVTQALKECFRVLKWGGWFHTYLIDMQKVGEHIYRNQLHAIVERTPQGPVIVHDLVYGTMHDVMEDSESGAMHSGFTSKLISNQLVDVGFTVIYMERQSLTLKVSAQKGKLSNQLTKPMIDLREEDVNAMMTRRDDINQPPEYWLEQSWLKK